MAGGGGRIPDRDIAAIRERVRIEDVVSDYVALKRAGADSLLGLCPFHDERTPSFHIRPNHGHFHCFGCNEGGDVYAFLQKIDHIGFTEAVEQMADRVGYKINYSGGGTSVQRDRGTRSRLVAANAAAQEFFLAQLREPEAASARTYLTERNFDAAAAARFGCGYAPGGWDTLTKHLRKLGFEAKELEGAGLSKAGRRGPIDAFHRRLTWPIRNLAGDVIGFGARRLFDDDPIAGKYLNTRETMLYKKSQVMFGIDHAKRDIARSHQAVVVEGYTDVMAMHSAGVSTAVASCGTAFGDEHLAVLRRLLMDDQFWRGEIIYTFDGDAAGQAAAMKAFAGDQKLAGQTFIAVIPDGKDPCELRQTAGDAAVRDLVARRVPLFQFVIKGVVDQCNVETTEGQVEALRRAVPIVAQIKDNASREAYARRLAGWVGWDDIKQVVRRVGEHRRRGGAAPAARRPVTPEPNSQVVLPRSNDPALWPERDSLKAALQYPAIAGPVFDSVPADAFTHPAYAAVRTALAAAGGTAHGLDGPEWVSTVADHTDDLTLRVLVSELAAEELPAVEAAVPRYVNGVLARLQETWVGRQVAELKSKLTRLSQEQSPDTYHELFGDLVALEQYRRSLLQQAMGE